MIASVLRWIIASFICTFGAVVFAQTTVTKRQALADLGDNPIVRVLLIDSVTSIALSPEKSAWKIKNLSGGREIATLQADQITSLVLESGQLKLVKGNSSEPTKIGNEAIVLEPPSDEAVLGIRKVPYGVGWWWASEEDRRYAGKIEVHPAESGNLIAVAVLPLETYLRGVTPSEIGADSPLQALCAQAVAARSAAVLALTTSIYSGKHFDICSDVACQAFSGVSKCTAASDESVSSTRGVILSFEGKPVSAYYASNCGGYTEDIRNVWPDRASDRSYWNAGRFDGPATASLDLSTEEGARQWQTADPDCYCNPTKHKVAAWAKKYFRWTAEISAEELSARVALKEDVGRVTAFRALKRGPSGRIIEAEFVGEKGTLKVSPELAIRQIWDPPLKSSAFVVEALGNAQKPDKFIVRGAGWGHGVGMCQTGAIGMANEGKSYREILKHYYSNVQLEKLY